MVRRLHRSTTRPRLRESVQSNAVKHRRQSIVNQSLAEIDDFNALQAAVKRDQSKYSRLQETLREQPQEVQETVKNFVNESRKYVDYDALEQKVIQSDMSFV